ncbi:MAG: hypothetical protein Q8Q07_06065 [Dehalococcoidales bacterium]|nr:hypothetical protein [Dehalococcoidales bacterium]
MGDIKSAFEIAMEKVEKLGDASEEERLRWKYVPEGEQLGARYLKEDCNLLAELGRYPDKTRKYVIEGAAEVLIRNIGLPRNEVAKKTNKRAMDGLKMLKNNKGGMENVFSGIRNIFNHYAEQGEGQRKQAYASLKADFEAKIRQAMQQQPGSFLGAKIDVEKQPQFQQQWRAVLTRLDSQYLNHLNEYKKELAAIQ